MSDYLKNLDIEIFQNDLINWYNQVKRDLPWRKNLDPYQILVSEIMLQQTQVSTVIPYYERFMALFPTTKELAKTDETTLLKAWEGLGYYSRARNLQKSAQMIEEIGHFPATHAEILKLKGVGPYTAGAIASIAFSVPAPAVDGNVFRVISRVCCIFCDIMKPKTRKTFENVVAQLISIDNPGDFNQGLMELGATICKPKSPKCLECPIQSHCKAYQQGIDDQLPVKSKAVKQTKIKLVVGIIENQHGEMLIEKRDSQGLLANFYEFKTFEYEGGLEPSEILYQKLMQNGYKVEAIRHLGIFSHIFTHRIWEMDSYRVNVHMDSDTKEQGIWIKLEDLPNYPLAVAHVKILRQLAHGVCE